jgi:hypothetical protein
MSVWKYVVNWMKTYYFPKTKQGWVNRAIEWFIIAVFLITMFYVTQSWHEGFTSGYNACLNNMSGISGKFLINAS